VVRLVTEKTPDGQRLPDSEPAQPTVVCVCDRGEPGIVRAVVEYHPEGGDPIPVTRIEVNTGMDVALLRLQRPAPAMLMAGPVTIGAQWRVETRPQASDPTLTGTVTDPHRRLRNQQGKETTLIQLLVREELGDYQGYSGSPVISQPAGGEQGHLLGVLVEQQRWRISPQLGQPAPVANVLFAAPISEVLAEFDIRGVTVSGPAMTIPRSVAFEVRRPQLNRVIDTLLGNLTQPSPDGQLVGLVGMSGSGKSVLAAAVARDQRMRDAFPEGQFWLDLGPNPQVPQLQAGLAAALGDSTPITDLQQGRALLSRLLGERRCLLVLDNVWARTDLSAFAVVGSTGGLLVTTRDATILPGNTGIPLDEFAPDMALQLLAGWTGTPASQLPPEAAQVAQECGYLPLALALCGAMIGTGDHSWPQLLELLRHADLEALQSQDIDYPNPSLAAVLGASIGTLAPDARDRYMQLAVFDAQGPVPPAALRVVWSLDPARATALIEELAGKSLLRVEAGSRVSLHDLQMDYLVRSAPDLPALHDRLLAAYRQKCHGGWATCPDDGYFHQHLARHLQRADHLQELRTLLLDLDWMNAKLAAGNVPRLLADYGTLPSDPVVQLVANALRLSALVLADDPRQLPGQLTGRLTGEQDPQLRDLLQRTRRWAVTPWLCPLTASLTPAGGPLQLTLTSNNGDRTAAVAVSTDGRRAVSLGWDGYARVWDLSTGEPLLTLADHYSWVHTVAISPDGHRAVSGSDDGTVRVWDLGTGELLRTMAGHGDGVKAVAVSADGRRALSGGHDGTVRVWDLGTGEPLHTLTGHVPTASDGRDYVRVSTVAVSADGRRAASGGHEGTVRVWDLGTGEELHNLAANQGWVRDVAISADGSLVVCGGDRGTVRVWDLHTGELLHTLTMARHESESVSAVAVSADGRRVVSGSDYGLVRVWDIGTGELLHTTLDDHGVKVSAVALSTDGRRIVSGGDGGIVRVWDIGTGEPPHTVAGHGDAVPALAISADGSRAVSGGHDSAVRVWDFGTGELLHTLIGHERWVRAVAVSADGSRAVSGGQDSTVRVWNLGTGELLHSLVGDQNAVTALAVSADGRLAISGGYNGTLLVWDLGAGELLHALAGHQGWVSGVAISADGGRAVSGGQDGTLLVWDLKKGKLASQRRWIWLARRYYQAVMSFAVSADGRRAVSSCHDGTLRVWDLGTGELLHAMAGHETTGGHAVAISADGRRAVSGGADKTVRMWDLDTGTLLLTLLGHTRWVADVAISADGRRAVSGGLEGVVLVWDLEQRTELASFTSDAGITALAAAPSCTRLIAGTEDGPVHFLELRGYNQPEPDRTGHS
jgi:WD40 repeat protein